ncbi:CHASE2 domain-containing protein [Calothrix sp. 336/3]|uniref:CHASE2 domain-containing protein n=1 Tax=Calothrix sp. 336/3 TaxID=1337936 RepID=UPI0004E46E01|nr:CHASE2 domain-containing protein [Calothrix sp. 336/3]AKG20882.1 Chase2 sensor protein [Calothrix sp. 336/3]
MSHLVVLNLGKGELQYGFPTVTAQLWEEDGMTPIQFSGSLPPMPNLATLYQRWQRLYTSLYNNLSWRRTRSAHPEFEIDEDDDTITNISHHEFQEICEELGTELNRWLSANSFLGIDRKLRTNLTPKDEIRLVIAAENPQILRLPWSLWEFLSDYPQAEIALSLPEYARSLKTNISHIKKKVKILSIFGNSEGINLTQDKQILAKLPNAEITFLLEPTSQELNEQLWQSDWDMLFFAGHSSSQEKGCIQINSTDSLTIDQLKYGLRKAISRGLKLAVFNSCDGLGLAQDLADLHLPQVIVMREPVPDGVAQEFLKHFLTLFAKGESLYTAVREAREKLQGLEGEFPCATWLPVICQNPAENPSTWREWCGKAKVKRSLPNHQETRLILLSSLVSTLLIGGVRFFGFLSPLDFGVFDLLLRSRITENPDERILVVTVTPEDVQSQGKEPRFGSLSDTTLNQLLQKLETHQPAVIGLDIYRDYPSQEPQLIQKLKKSQGLISICKRPDRRDDPTGTLPPPEVPPARVAFSDFVQDMDGIVRRQLLFMTHNSNSRCTASYSLSSRLAFEYLSKQGIKVEFTKDNYLKLNQIIFPSIHSRTGGYQGVNTGGSQILLNYRAMENPQLIAPQVTLQDILTDKVNPLAIKNKIILIGITDPSMGDYWATPWGAGSSAQIPGVVIHAQMVSQILSAVLDKRPLIWVWSMGGEILWIGLWSVVGGLIAWWFRRLIIMTTVLGSCIILLTTTCIVILHFGGWVPLVAPLFTMLLTNGTLVYVFLKK